VKRSRLGSSREEVGQGERAGDQPVMQAAASFLASTNWSFAALA
jgi:hypothetical protein